MKRLAFSLLGLLLLTSLGGCGNSRPTRSIDFLPLRAIEITSQNPQAATGTTNRFTAIGHYGDPTTFQFTRSITDQVTWTSSNDAVLSFSADPALVGLATAGTPGTATITATMDGIAADASFTVTNATIQSVTIPAPSSTTLYVGRDLSLQAYGTFSDGTRQELTQAVDWSSSDEAIATVASGTADAGRVSSVAPGTVDITAGFGAQSATQSLEVSAAALDSITVTAEDSRSTLAQGTSLQLTATGAYSDGTTQDLTDQVSWTSSDTTIAAIDQDAGTNGLLSGLAPGTVTVTASLQGTESSALSFTVSSATLTSLSITPASPSVAVGDTLQLTATGDFSDGTSQDLTRDVTWSTSDSSVATVSASIDSEGTVKGLTSGSVTISADSGNIPTALGAALVATADLTVQ